MPNEYRKWRSKMKINKLLTSILVFLEQILERAMEYYQSDIADKNDPHIQKYQEQLCTCYLKRTDMIDFDFWTRYIELLEDPTIDFDEYTELDSRFDGSIEDVTTDDKETITYLNEILSDLRRFEGDDIKELEYEYEF